MTNRKQLNVALTIAGSDSGGGAGIQADLKTFSALGVHGTSAITCVTAQNPSGVRSIQPVRPAIVRDQIDAILDGFPVRAAKTGMLYSAAIVKAVAASLRARKGLRVVVDPVMVATSGARLLQPNAVRVLQDELLPWAALVTPNVPEAEILVDARIRTIEDSREAARVIHKRFGCAALVKGGHLTGLREAVDLFTDGKTELLLSARFVRGISTHGTGCTYSAAITAWLARGHDLTRAVICAKGYIAGAIAGSRKAGGHGVLSWNFSGIG
ncbi:MAG: bifunctional hydroxymethylpyrimidine kinase/phosphomethylpyrimidine kinase [Verrucomicrobiota bacterium]|nr:bifunctional hydroxymethylpyrimidine kinase/phosphomethylpyrimidine kinase [Verrucomicrobiota bacterium]